MSNGVRLNAPHLVLGLFVMAFGFVLVLDRLGVVGAEQFLRFWPMGLVLLGGAMVVQSLADRGDASAQRRSTFPVGSIFWIVVAGLVYSTFIERQASTDGAEQAKVFAMMGGDRRALVTDRFRGADITTLMGGANLDLTQARIPPGEEAVLDVFTMMGGATLVVPRDWVIDVQATSILGGIDDKRTDGDERAPRRGRSRNGRWTGPVDDNGDAPDVNARAGGEAEAAAADEVAAEEVQPEPPAPPSEPPIERADPVPPNGKGPRLIIRGFLMMGGLQILPPES
jgi:hypothetical protein